MITSIFLCLLKSNWLSSIWSVQIDNLRLFVVSIRSVRIGRLNDILKLLWLLIQIDHLRLLILILTGS